MKQYKVLLLLGGFIIGGSLVAGLILTTQNKTSRNSERSTPTTMTTATAAPIQYTDLFEDETFYLAEHNTTLVLFYSSAALRKDLQSFVNTSIADYGVITYISSPYEQSAKTTVSFTQLTKRVKLFNASTIAVDASPMLSFIPGYEDNTYYFSFITTLKSGTTYSFSQFTYFTAFDSAGTATVKKVREYTFGEKNSSRGTSGPEILKASLSKTHIAVNVLGCWGCEPGLEPNIYILNLSSNTEKKLGAAVNVKAVNGLTYIYEGVKKEPSACSLDKNYEGICYPYTYNPDGKTYTNILE